MNYIQVEIRSEVLCCSASWISCKWKCSTLSLYCTVLKEAKCLPNTQGWNNEATIRYASQVNNDIVLQSVLGDYYQLNKKL